MPKFCLKRIFLLLGALTLSLPASSLANNGLYLAGYGAESLLMGGADVAVARDAFAANNNPAGMTQLTGQAAEGELAAFYSLDVTHTDSFGNYRKWIGNPFGGFGNAAYARRFENSPYAAGVAVVIQGGLGWEYHGLNTNPALGAKRDDASSLFTIVKVAPAFAWEVNDQLSLGVALGVTYMSASQELFPNSSAAPSVAVPSGFTGIRFKGASGIGLNSKWGLQYHPAKDVTIGVTYGTQTSIPLKDGALRINFSDPSFGGLGVVRYDNAKLVGLRLPEELAVGIAFRPTPPLLISLQDKWYNWSDALNKLTLTASNPRTPGAPATVVIPSALDFTDQHVIAVGFAYDLSKETTLLAGVNHGSRAIPDQNITPIFAAIHARHYMLGVSHKLDDGWKISGGLQYFAFQSATYDSAIFGPRASEHNNAAMLHLMVERNW